MAREMLSPRHVCNWRRRTREGPELACVETPFLSGVAGRINVLSWYRVVGVAKTSSETQRRKNRAARNGTWSPRGTGKPTGPTYPGSAPRKQARLVKTVKIQVEIERLVALEKTVGSRMCVTTPGSRRSCPG